VKKNADPLVYIDNGLVIQTRTNKRIIGTRERARKKLIQLNELLLVL